MTTTQHLKKKKPLQHSIVKGRVKRARSVLTAVREEKRPIKILLQILVSKDSVLTSLRAEVYQEISRKWRCLILSHEKYFYLSRRTNQLRNSKLPDTDQGLKLRQ